MDTDSDDSTDTPPMAERSFDALLDAAREAGESDQWVQARMMLSKAMDVALESQADERDLADNLVEAIAEIDLVDADADEVREILQESEGPVNIIGASIGGLHLDDVPAQLARDIEHHYGPLRIVIESEDRDGHHWTIRYEDPEPDDLIL